MSSIVGKLAVVYARNFPNHRGRFRLFSLLDRCFGPFVVRTAEEFSLEVFLSSAMDLSYFRNQNSRGPELAIDHIVPALIRELKPGECFIDVGANIGWLSNLASRVVGQEGRVVSFEPSPREYVRLIHGILLNKAENIIPVNCALGEAPSVAVLEVARDHTGLNRLASAAGPAGSGWTKVAVPVWTGDEVLPPLVGSRAVGLLKIDTEGAELLVLSGLKRFIAKFRPRKIVVEITPAFLLRFGSDKKGIYELLSVLDYVGTINSDLPQYDEVFVAR
ncbi:MAG: FkbM family methyltransferase [Opitutaceae bacterium]|nr:FkbM family methyltransferase [Opitutaceae bacterium]